MLACLGHLVFMAIHAMCFLFGFVGLIISIPLHLIFAVLTRR